MFEEETALTSACKYFWPDFPSRDALEAQGEFEWHCVRSIKNTKAFWLWPSHPPLNNFADHLICGSPLENGGGYFGRQLEFNIVHVDQCGACRESIAAFRFDNKCMTVPDSKTLRLLGPWHGNADSMLEDTGIDFRFHHATRGIIYSNPTNIAGSIIHADVEWVIGEYDRIDELAKLHANSLGIPVYIYVQTAGGAHSGPEFPSNTDEG